MAVQPRDFMWGEPLLQLSELVSALCAGILLWSSGHTQRIHMIKNCLLVPSAHIVVLTIVSFVPDTYRAASCTAAPEQSALWEVSAFPAFKFS